MRNTKFFAITTLVPIKITQDSHMSVGGRGDVYMSVGGRGDVYMSVGDIWTLELSLLSFADFSRFYFIRENIIFFLIRYLYPLYRTIIITSTFVITYTLLSPIPYYHLYRNVVHYVTLVLSMHAFLNLIIFKRKRVTVWQGSGHMNMHVRYACIYFIFIANSKQNRNRNRKKRLQ